MTKPKRSQPISLDTELIADLEVTAAADAVRGGASIVRKGEVAVAGGPVGAC